jgi:hypothetical protein
MARSRAALNLRGRRARSSVDFAGRTRRIEISAQEFSLKLRAPIAE